MSGITPTKQDAFKAAIDGNIEQVEIYLSSGHPVDELNDNKTLLYHAAMNGHVDLVKHLVKEKRADINIEYVDLSIKAFKDDDDDYSEMSLLGLLIHYGKTDMAIQLCELGASVDYVSGDYISAFQMACASEDLQMMEYLVEHYEIDLNMNPDQQDAPILFLARYGNVELVQWMINHGAAVIDEYFDNVFMVGAQEGDVEMMALGYTYLPEINLLDGTTPGCEEGYAPNDTPLQAAFKSGNFDAVRWLEERIDSASIDWMSLFPAFGLYTPELASYLLTKFEPGEWCAPHKLLECYAYNILSSDNLALLEWLHDQMPASEQVVNIFDELISKSIRFYAINILNFILQKCQFRANLKYQGGLTPLHIATFNMSPTEKPAKFVGIVGVLLRNGANMYYPAPGFGDFMVSLFKQNKTYPRIDPSHFAYIVLKVCAISGYQLSDKQLAEFMPLMNEYYSRSLSPRKEFVRLTKDRWVHPASYALSRLAQRTACIEVFSTAWRLYGGKFDAVSAQRGVQPALCPIIATIADKRICGTIEHNGVNQPIEPLGRDVIGFLGAPPIHETPTRDSLERLF